MTWVFAFAALAVVALGVVAATGRLGGMRERPVRDVYEPHLPAGMLTEQDLAATRFRGTARGYAMDQVDDLLDRLRGEIDERDRELARLRAADADRPDRRPVPPPDRPPEAWKSPSPPGAAPE